MVKYLSLALTLFILAGCASMKTSLKQYAGIDEKIVTRDFQGAIQQIEAAKEKHYQPKEKVLYYLDLGMLHFYARDYSRSNELLEEAEKAIEENFTKSVSKAAASLLLNDNALDYPGEDYEDIYLNIFKALNYLELNSFDAAFVEINRINIKLNKLEDKYRKMAHEMEKSDDSKTSIETARNNFYNDALARYLSLLIYRAEGKMDDANIDYRKIQEAWQAHANIYNFAQPDLTGHLARSNRVKLNFISFVGKGPVKKAKTMYIHTEDDLIIIAATDQLPEGEQELAALHTIPWDGVKKGYHFKFQLPYMENRGSCVGRIHVTVDDYPPLQLEQLENMSAVALETYKLKETVIYFKTIIRTVSKSLFAAKRKEEMEKKIDNPLLGLAARLAVDAAVDATENADLRISRFFPALAYIGEIEVDPSVQQIRIEYFAHNGNLLYVEEIPQYQFKRSGLNLINSFYLN